MKMSLRTKSMKISDLLVKSGVLLMILGNILFIAGCGKPPDQKAYEEVIATMSMDKARGFFDKYPQSRYRDKLADEIIGWCEQENTEDCYKLILETLPGEHPRYKEIVAYYEKHFEKER